MTSEAFAELACEPDPPVEELALGLAAEFGSVDAASVRQQLDALGAEVRGHVRPARTPEGELEALRKVLAAEHGFHGDTREYDHPDNSLLPRVLERRRGLPITLSVLYVAVARRARIPLHGVGLPGHYVVGRFDGPARLIDPFGGGGAYPVPEGVPTGLVAPCSAHATALRMLNNLVGSFARRGALAHAIHAAELRLLLPVDPADMEALTLEVRALRARLN